MSLRIIFLCFIIVIQSLNIYAESLAGMAQLPTPADTTKSQEILGGNKKDLTPSQLGAIEKALLTTGGSITPETMEALKRDPEAIEAFKNNPEFNELTPEEIESFKNGKSSPAGMDRSYTGEKEEAYTDKSKGQAGKEYRAEKEDKDGKRFGLDFFKPARNRILSVEEKLGRGHVPLARKLDATSGYVGPLDMIDSDVNATVPAHYALSPGDNVIIHFWADSIALTTYKTKVDEHGKIPVPQLGRLVVRGMTLAQLQDSLKSQMQRVLGKKNISLIATLDSLKSMQIFITGEAFRPGSYTVSAVTSLFNALHACGGPNNYGSLRKIKLLRGNSTNTIDFYDYLINGDSKQDYNLYPRDTIFIPRVDKLVAIKGEVNRPSIFELKKDEKLKSLIEYAGGLKPTGFIERVQIGSVKPNKERIIKDVDLSIRASFDVRLLDGDSVFVPSILPGIVNMVSLKGKVEHPGDYELKEGMRVSDLFSDDNQPLGEAYMERADIIRLNADGKTTTLIATNLGKALSKDIEHNIRLLPFDKIIVYSKWEIKFLPSRLVTVSGAVQRPGRYERSDGMTVMDLLVVSGGLMPDTDLKRADLLRYDYSSQKYLNIPINLVKAQADIRSDNILLKDSDTFTVYSLKDVEFTPDHKVDIHGAVQRPGEYKRSEGMKLSDLLYAAGGVLPWYYEKIEIAKARNEGETETIEVNLKLLNRGDAIHDHLLEDGDIVMVRRRSDFYDEPPWVEIDGEIEYPGRYPLLSKRERLSSIVAGAGGMTEYAYPKGIVLKRKSENINTDTQRDLLADANQLVNLMNDFDFQRQIVRNQWLMLEAKGEEVTGDAIPKSNISISSGDDPAEAAAIGMAPGVASATGQAVDKFLQVSAAFPAVSAKARKFSIQNLEPKGMQRLILEIESVSINKKGEDDIILMPGDTIFIPREPETVYLTGALISSPSLIKYNNGKEGRKYEYYINRVGGYADDANIDNVLIARLDGSVMRVEDIEKIEPGDIIYVPPKVISLEIVSKTDRIIDAVKFGLVTVSSVVAFIVLVGMF